MDDQLTLETAVKKAKESEAIKQQQQTIRHGEATEVDAVRKSTSKQPRHPKNVFKKAPAQSQICTRCGQLAHAKKMTCPAKTSCATDVIRGATSRRCVDLSYL